MSEILEKKKKKYENSRWIMASYGSRGLFSQWVTSAFGLYTIFFYETVIGLDNRLTILTFIIYSLWNAVNDPIIGYLIERFPLPWQKTKGYKRFPPIVITAIPWLLSYFAIFMVPYSWDPITDKWKIFTWFVISLCLFDGLFSVMDINANSLFPEKFRDSDERRVTSGFRTIFGIMGIALAFLITGLFIPDTTGLQRLEVMPYYRTSATVTLIGGIFLFFMFIPGVFENKKIRTRNLNYLNREKVEKTSFFKSAKPILSNKAFIVKIIFMFGYQAAVGLVNASALYVTTYILDAPGSMIFLLAPMLVGAIITVPFWVFIGNKFNNNRLTGIIVGITMFISFIPMIFVNNLIGWAISLFLFGIGLAGQWWGNMALMADIIDDHIVKTGKQETSLYYGYQTFFVRFGEAFKVITIALTHILTKFPEGTLSLSDLKIKNPTSWQTAVFGIRIHATIVPAILVAITTILFWLFYPLTAEKTTENKKILAEMNL